MSRQYRIGAQQRRVGLGTTATMDVDEARRAARSVLAKVHLGQDPQAGKAEARVLEARTLGSIAGLFLAWQSKRLRPRSFVEVERHFRVNWADLAPMPLNKIQRADVAAENARTAKEHGRVAADRTQLAVAPLCVGDREGYVETNPVVGTNKQAEEVARDRVLTDAELVQIWTAAAPSTGSGADYGDIVHLLILTGQRREEVGGMLWSELAIDRGIWTIGAERSKNGRAHDVPLSEPALAILQARLPFKQDNRDFVFGLQSGPFSGWSRAKQQLDARLKGEPWRLHDVRRTVATRMAALGVLPHVIEAVLNHISGHKAGVAGIYNRASYANEKRQALDIWAAHVLALVEGRESTVVPLRRA